MLSAHPEQVAGAATNNVELTAHQCRSACPTAFPYQPLAPGTGSSRQERTGTVSSPDNGSAYTSRQFRAHLADHGITHRRGGYRDPESQAFIESWFSKLKLRCVWREEFETLQQARAVIGAYIDGYHHRPHSGLNYKTPREVAATWQDHQDQPKPGSLN